MQASKAKFSLLAILFEASEWAILDVPSQANASDDCGLS